MNRVGLPGDVERVDRQRPVAELLVRSGVLRQDQHAVALVHERRLLGDEVQPVEDRVHEEDVVVLVRGDGAREVVADLEVDRHPAVLLEAVVDAPRLALDRADVLGVLGDLLPRRVEQREQADAAVHLRMRVEVELERAEAAHDVLRRIGAVDAQHELLRPVLRELASRPRGRPGCARARRTRWDPPRSARRSPQRDARRSRARRSPSRAPPRRCPRRRA